MAKSITIEFISAGFHDILCGSGVKSVVDQAGQRIANEASASGGEFAYTGKQMDFGGGRWGGYIAAKDYAARRAEAKDKALSRAVHA